MNANHARPMAAFWLLALVAGVITVLGLRADGGHVTLRSGAPSPVTRSASPELVLGDQLRAQPTSTATASLAAQGLVSPLSGAILVTQFVAPPSAGDAHARSEGGAHQSSTAPTATSTTPAAKATSTVTSGPGKSRHHRGHGKGKATATATVRPTASGNGHGRSETHDGHGKGHDGPNKKAHRRLR